MYDNNSIKIIAFRVPDEFHKAVKIQAVKDGKSLQEYIIDILTRDMDNKKEV